MSKDRAVIEGEFTGAPKIEADAKKVNRALGDVKKNAGEGIAASFNKATAGAQVFGAKVDALKGLLDPRALLGGFIGGAVGGALSAGLGAVTNYLTAGTEKAKTFEERSSQMGRTLRTSLGGLRTELTGNEQAALQSADAQMDYLQAVEQTTYRGRDAELSLKTVAQVATLMGRKAVDMAPFTTALQAIHGSGADAGHELEQLQTRAERLGNVGGVKALVDTVAALGPALQNVSREAGAAGDKLLAMAHVLQAGGMRPGQAQSVTAGAVGMIQSRWADIERTLGHDVLDEEGNVKDPVQTLKEIKAAGDKKYGKGASRAKRWAYVNEFGPQLGKFFNGLTDEKIGQMESEAANGQRANLDVAFDRFLQGDHGAIAQDQRAQFQTEAGERYTGGYGATAGRMWNRASAAAFGLDTTGGGAPGAPPTVHLSTESADRVATTMANKLKESTLKAKIEATVDGNAQGGN